jgi:hypothetical protein
MHWQCEQRHSNPPQLAISLLPVKVYGDAFSGLMARMP